MSLVFGGETSGAVDPDSPEIEKLYAQIGQLKVENDFLKKSARKLGIPESEWK
jgi:cell division protein FtsB